MEKSVRNKMLGRLMATGMTKPQSQYTQTHKLKQQQLVVLPLLANSHVEDTYMKSNVTF